MLDNVVQHDDEAARREDWLVLARKLDWTLRYVDERDAFPEDVSGHPWLPAQACSGWSEPYGTTFAEYVRIQCDKEAGLAAMRDALDRASDVAALDSGWLAGVKLHTATLPLAELGAVVGNLRAARFARDGAWRSMAALGALDELRHTQIPLLALHALVREPRAARR